MEQRKREKLLGQIGWFVEGVSKIQGVRRVALLGSLMTDKKVPKDIDYLVMVEDDADLEPLALWGRRASGRAHQFGGGADVFLQDTRGKYIGRTCHWKDCGPGIRTRCDALNCGKRHYLHDDLEAITLSREKMLPALKFWPKLERREGLPADLDEVFREFETRSESDSVMQRTS